MKDDIEQVYNAYKDNIYAIAFNYFKNSIDADDVVQEVFLKYCKEGETFVDEKHIKHWLIRVAVNECKRVTLSTWFKRKEPLGDYMKSLAFTEPEQSEVFLQVMNLPKKYRQVLHLYYYEDYKTSEIGELLGISQSAVTTRLARGRKELKAKLLEVWEDDNE